MGTDQPLPLPPPSPSSRPHPLHHRGLVVRFAKRYRHCGIEWADLLQIGTLGLLRACEKFDPERDRKFSTYARHWIRATIVRAIYNQARPIRVPIHVRQAIGRGVTPDSPGLTATQRDNLRSALLVMYGECNPLTELLTCDPVDDVGYSYAEDVAPRLKNLPARERDILVRFFGIHGPPMTYQEIAAEAGLSKQRIAQLVKVALRKLHRAIAKHPGSLPDVRTRPPARPRA